eukprot:2167003-Rhodomonas_salina.1
MSGTEVAYGAARRYDERVHQDACDPSQRCSVCCYALSGTDVDYAATRWKGTDAAYAATCCG